MTASLTGKHNVLHTVSKKYPYIGVVLIALALILLPWVASSVGNAWVRILDFACLYILLALGLNIVIGYAGLLDLGYVAFYAVGAYVAGFLASGEFGIHLPFWLLVPLGALIAAFAGVLLGFPVLRLRGDYLAIVTLGFGEIVRILMNNLEITNGPQGIQTIYPVSMFGVSLGGVRNEVDVFGLILHPTMAYYYFFLVIVVLAIVVCMRLEKSRLGRAWMAIREDEVAAKAIGINTRNVKLLAFGLGATFGGVSGVLFASFQRFVSPESFVLQESVMIVAMVVLGGMGHIPGVILGSVLLVALPEALRYLLPTIQIGIIKLDAELLRQLFFALAMILVMIYRPLGLWPAKAHGAQKSDT